MFKKMMLFIGFLLLLPACTTAGESNTTTASQAAVPQTAVPQPTTSPTETAPTPIPEPTATTTTVADPSPIPIQTFTMVPEESKALYRVEEEFFQGAVDNLGQVLGFNTAVGWTRTMEGSLQLTIDGQQVTVEGGQFTIDLRTLKSDERHRDEHIRDGHLESNRFPFADFVITSVDGLPDNYRQGETITFNLTGDLTMREITKEVTLETTAVLQDNTITATAITEIMMVDYGFDPPAVGNFFEALDPARIEIELKAITTN